MGSLQGLLKRDSSVPGMQVFYGFWKTAFMNNFHVFIPAWKQLKRHLSDPNAEKLAKIIAPFADPKFVDDPYGNGFGQLVFEAQAQPIWQDEGAWVDMLGPLTSLLQGYIESKPEYAFLRNHPVKDPFVTINPWMIDLRSLTFARSIREAHFDQMVYLKNVVKEMEMARKSGTEGKDLVTLLTPLTGAKGGQAAKRKSISSEPEPRDHE